MSRSLEQVILANARALLDNESRWTSGAWARDAQGVRCDPLAPEAVRWCAVGALEVSAFGLIGEKRQAKVIAKRIAKQIAPGPGGLVYINECGPHDAVKQALRASGTLPASVLAGCDRHGFGPFSRRV